MSAPLRSWFATSTGFPPITATCSVSPCSIAIATAPRSAPASVALLHLEHRPDAKPDDTREAGLYHTAYLMPTRGDLARWILHVARNKVPLTGASDHGISEAIYLDDPEGNGIEVYRDRPPESWQWSGNELRMITDPLDIEDILREVAPTAVVCRRADRAADRTHPSARRRRGRRRAVLPRCRGTRSHPPPPWCVVHVVGTLPPSHRRQCLAQRRRRAARQRPGWIVLARARSFRRCRLRDGEVAAAAGRSADHGNIERSRDPSILGARACASCAPDLAET